MRLTAARERLIIHAREFYALQNSPTVFFFVVAHFGSLCTG